ncbi:tRNA1(Val) (adenine(37)-N6)-methyltransferase [Albirhodobacter sp. R86504]|uniref:tRNA1(Val) (adenine(37)-N6)-methyltransferase n=1 Tax=Albirhodobacter sp. R86504 TaxID=3093848 RepID=UPI00367011FD
MSFSAIDLSLDKFLGGKLLVSQPKNGYRAAMDPVLLAAACSAERGETVLELGCGVGVASLCLGYRTGADVTGIELQPEYADLARANGQRNAVDLKVYQGDLALMPSALRAQSFDHVIANPPYFPPASGTAAADAGRETGQREATPLALWVSQGLKRLHPRGWITIIQNADRMGDVLCALTASRAGSVTVLPIASRADRPAGRVIIQARKLGRGPLKLLAPFVLHAGAYHAADGEDLTAAARAIFRDGANLPLIR